MHAPPEQVVPKVHEVQVAPPRPQVAELAPDSQTPAAEQQPLAQVVALHGCLAGEHAAPPTVRAAARSPSRIDLMQPPKREARTIAQPGTRKRSAAGDGDVSL